MSPKEEHLLGQHTQHRDTSTRREEMEATLPLREEVLDVRTEEVETGHASVRTEVVQKQRRIDVPVTREAATIERRPVDRRPSQEPISETTAALNVVLHEDQITVDKQAVIYEEVEVGKRTIQHAQHVSETVRKEVVDVDAEGDLQVDRSSASKPQRDRSNT
jgi:uncharacterized protein (TIGR02271 family)